MSGSQGGYKIKENNFMKKRFKSKFFHKAISKAINDKKILYSKNVDYDLSEIVEENFNLISKEGELLASIPLEDLKNQAPNGCLPIRSLRYGCLGFTALAAILSAVIVPSLEKIFTESNTDFIKNTIINIFNECTFRSKEGLSTTFSDINSLIDNSVGAVLAPDFQIKEFGEDDTCFNIIAYPPDEYANEITWFSIKLDPETGKVSKTCGDSSKPGCEEGNTW